MCCLGSACTELSESYPAKHSKSQIRETQGNPEAKPQRVRPHSSRPSFHCPSQTHFSSRVTVTFSFRKAFSLGNIHCHTARRRLGDWLSNHPCHLQAHQLATIPSLL